MLPSSAVRQALGVTVVSSVCIVCVCINNHIYSTLFKIQERKSDRRSREIEQRKESQNTHKHKTRTCDLNLLH